MTEKIETQKPAETAPVDLPLNEKMIQILKEYVETLIVQLKSDVEKRLIQERKAIEDELTTSVRAGLGITKDPAVHLSEVEGMVRKILLDVSPSGKKTITETTDKPAEGDVTKTQKIDVETRFNDMLKNKGAF